jgi:hypothetical protein
MKIRALFCLNDPASVLMEHKCLAFCGRSFRPGANHLPQGHGAIAMKTLRSFTMKTMMALILAASFSLPAIATAQTSQSNPNFSQGKQAPVLSDGASTGYNSYGQR